MKPSEGSPLTISADEVASQDEGRFQRFGLIDWWNQKRLDCARVLVIGAGALGNEIIKNLALLGIGNVCIVDLDTVENSNLSRSVLYREADCGLPKAEVAARAAQSIYPRIRVRAIRANVIHDLGMGLFRWADVVLAGLDNREARLTVNRHCWRVGRPWIDGAIERIRGTARVFVPDGPCYECTMTATDWQLLQKRRSCNLLTRAEMEEGKTPTTPTISSIIAGVQCQEALKLLHGLDTIRGRGWIFEGLSTDSYVVDFQRKEDCYSHDRLDEIVVLTSGSRGTTVQDIIHHARSLLGPEAEIELARDILEKLVCPRCKQEEFVLASLASVTSGQAFCPKCVDVRRDVVTFYRLRGDEHFSASSLAEIGLPAWDIVIARAGDRSIGLELGGDAPGVLGPLSHPGKEESHGD